MASSTEGEGGGRRPAPITTALPWMKRARHALGSEPRSTKETFSLSGALDLILIIRFYTALLIKLSHTEKTFKGL